MEFLEDTPVEWELVSSCNSYYEKVWSCHDDSMVISICYNCDE